MTDTFIELNAFKIYNCKVFHTRNFIQNYVILRVRNSELSVTESEFIDNYFLGTLFDIPFNLRVININNNFFANNRNYMGYLLNINTNTNISNNLISKSLSNSTIKINLPLSESNLHE